MDAPSNAPSSEPFMEGTPLFDDQPMMDEFFEGFSGDFWGGEEVLREPPTSACRFMAQINSEDGQANGCSMHWDSVLPALYQSQGYGWMQSSSHSSSASNNPLMSTSLSVSGIGVEHNPIVPFHLLLDTGAPPGLAVNFCQDANALHQTGSIPANATHGHLLISDNIPDAQKLANLPKAQLESLAKDVNQALAVVKRKKQQKSDDSVNPKQKETNIKKSGGTRKQSQDKGPLFECEHPGCHTTFRHNKDRKRHMRIKHEEATGFICPIVDCAMGTGHTVARLDKLREHLRGRAASSKIWRCVIPNCFESGATRSWWFDHLAHHDWETRSANYKLLINYGYKGFYQGYFWLSYLCVKSGCPFGTQSSEAMEEHLLIQHDGPHCSCPLPECKAVCKNWEEVAQHLAARHSPVTRRAVGAVLSEHGFDWGDSAFTCPIPSCGLSTERSYYGGVTVNRARQHCLEHDFTTLLSAANPLVAAWRFCVEGQRISIGPFESVYRAIHPSNSQIFALLAIPDAHLSKRVEDLDQLCLDRGINL